MTDAATHDANPQLLREFAANPSRSLRNRIVEANLGLAYSIADGFSDRGVDVEDLRQVAVVGLVKAISRFDPERGTAFASFAGPWIRGEIKHHFRDATWTVRVPRSAKELAGQVRRVRPELHQRLGRAPTVDEIASELDESVDDVIAAIDASAAHRTRPLSTTSSQTDLATRVGERDPALAQFEAAVLADELLALLDERERDILIWRFRDELSQREIAEKIDISQMHVSRLIRKSLATLQDHLDPDSAPTTD